MMKPLETILTGSEEGTTIRILLPYETTSERKVTGYNRGRILFIDDEASIRNLMPSYLGSLGYRVELASNGEEATQFLEQGQYVMVITDMGMRGKIDGYGVAEAAKNLDPETFVIIFSGSLPEHRPWYVDMFIQKPGIDELKTAVSTLLQKGEYHC